MDEDYNEFNFTEINYAKPLHPTSVKVLYDLIFLMCFLCVIVDSILIFLILKFKRLNQKKSNKIILNWTICNLLYMLSAALSLSLEWIIYGLWNTYTCIITELCVNFVLGDIVFIMLLTMHWMLEKHNPEAFLKLERHINFFIIINYVFLLFCGGIHVTGCLYHFFFGTFAGIFTAIGFIIYFIFTLIILITDFIKTKLNRNMQFPRNVNTWFTNIFFLSHFPVVIVGLIVGFLGVHYMITLYAALLTLFTPIFNLIMLYTLEPDYRLFLKHVFSCKFKEYNTELKEERLTFNNDMENPNSEIVINNPDTL